MRTQLAIPVVEPSQIGEARRAAVRVAETLGLNEVRRGEVAIVATELATNLARYGWNGRLRVQSLHTGPDSCVEMVAVDDGPGIDDVPRALQDGYSTGGSAGTGLGAIQRLSMEFDLYSTASTGTVVLSRIASARARETGFQWGAVSSPAPHEVVCGDTWRVAERDGEIALMLADGLGHGPLAAQAAELAAASFDEQPFAGTGAFCERAHLALNGSRGAALATAHATASLVRYAGVGNISGTIAGHEHSHGMISQNGTAGVQIRKPQQLEYPWPERALLVMHSDGLTSRWSIAAYEGLYTRHPAIIGTLLHRDHQRGRDDATILVARACARGGGARRS